MSKSNLVVWDPAGQYWEGALVSESESPALIARNVVLLPVRPHLFARAAIAGYFRRAWGSGWPIGSERPTMHCPMVIYALKEFRTIHWTARLVPESKGVPAMLAERRMQGGLKYTSDSGQLVGLSGGFATSDSCYIDPSQLGNIDEYGGWTKSGSASLQVTNDGLFTSAFFGSIPGVAIAWAAISQT